MFVEIDITGRARMRFERVQPCLQRPKPPDRAVGCEHRVIGNEVQTRRCRIIEGIVCVAGNHFLDIPEICRDANVVVLRSHRDRVDQHISLLRVKVHIEGALLVDIVLRFDKVSLNLSVGGNRDGTGCRGQVIDLKFTILGDLNITDAEIVRDEPIDVGEQIESPVGRHLEKPRRDFCICHDGVSGEQVAARIDLPRRSGLPVGTDRDLVRAASPRLNHPEDGVPALGNDLIDEIEFTGGEGDIARCRPDRFEQDAVTLRHGNSAESLRLNRHLIDGGVHLDLILCRHDQVTAEELRGKVDHSIIERFIQLNAHGTTGNETDITIRSTDRLMHDVPAGRDRHIPISRAHPAKTDVIGLIDHDIGSRISFVRVSRTERTRDQVGDIGAELNDLRFRIVSESARKDRKVVGDDPTGSTGCGLNHPAGVGSSERAYRSRFDANGAGGTGVDFINRDISTEIVLGPEGHGILRLAGLGDDRVDVEIPLRIDEHETVRGRDRSNPECRPRFTAVIDAHPAGSSRSRTQLLDFRGEIDLPHRRRGERMGRDVDGGKKIQTRDHSLRRHRDVRRTGVDFTDRQIPARFDPDVPGFRRSAIQGKSIVLQDGEILTRSGTTRENLRVGDRVDLGPQHGAGTGDSFEPVGFEDGIRLHQNRAGLCLNAHAAGRDENPVELEVAVVEPRFEDQRPPGSGGADFGVAPDGDGSAAVVRAILRDARAGGELDETVHRGRLQIGSHLDIPEGCRQERRSVVARGGSGESNRAISGTGTAALVGFQFDLLFRGDCVEEVDFRRLDDQTLFEGPVRNLCDAAPDRFIAITTHDNSARAIGNRIENCRGQVKRVRGIRRTGNGKFAIVTDVPEVDIALRRNTTARRLGDRDQLLDEFVDLIGYRVGAGFVDGVGRIPVPGEKARVERPEELLHHRHEPGDRVSDIERPQDTLKGFILAAGTLGNMVGVEDDVSLATGENIPVVEGVPGKHGQLDTTAHGTQPVDTVHDREVEVLVGNHVDPLGARRDGFRRFRGKVAGVDRNRVRSVADRVSRLDHDLPVPGRDDPRRTSGVRSIKDSTRRNLDANQAGPVAVRCNRPGIHSGRRENTARGAVDAREPGIRGRAVGPEKQVCARQGVRVLDRDRHITVIPQVQCPRDTETAFQVQRQAFRFDIGPHFNGACGDGGIHAQVHPLLFRISPDDGGVACIEVDPADAHHRDLFATVIDLGDVVVDSLGKSLLDQGMAVTRGIGNVDVADVAGIHPPQQSIRRRIKITVKTLELVTQSDRVEIVSRPPLEIQGLVRGEIKGVEPIVPGARNPGVDAVQSRSIRGEEDCIVALFRTLDETTEVESQVAGKAAEIRGVVQAAREETIAAEIIGKLIGVPSATSHENIGARAGTNRVRRRAAVYRGVTLSANQGITPAGGSRQGRGTRPPAEDAARSGAGFQDRVSGSPGEIDHRVEQIRSVDDRLSPSRKTANLGDVIENVRGKLLALENGVDLHLLTSTRACPVTRQGEHLVSRRGVPENPEIRELFAHVECQGISRHGTQLNARFLGVERDLEQFDGESLREDAFRDRPHEGNRNRQIDVKSKPNRSGKCDVEEVVRPSGE